MDISSFIRTDLAGNISQTKKNPQKKIDGVIAIIMALDRLLDVEMIPMNLQ
ncbi:MAG: hypothetical protein PUI80_02125 [Peptoniphilaceae bacterium]|nr:hypothetical protein [Peptoniphilaceae bacterium]